jgi:hypothetical protein
MDAGDVSEGLWAMARLRRSSARRGELGSVVFVDIRFQREARKAAGAAMGGGGLRPLMFSSISCRMDEGNKSGRGAWAR